MIIKAQKVVLIIVVVMICIMNGRLSASAEVTERYEKEIENLLQNMTLEEKVAQLFVILPEQLVDADVVTGAYEATKEAIDAVPVGGLVYMAQNLQSAEQIQEMFACPPVCG